MKALLNCSEFAAEKFLIIPGLPTETSFSPFTPDIFFCLCQSFELFCFFMHFLRRRHLIPHSKNASHRLNFCLFCARLSHEKIEAEINVTEFFIDLFDVWLNTIIIFLASHISIVESQREDPEMCVDSNFIFSNVLSASGCFMYWDFFCAISLRSLLLCVKVT